MKNRELAQWLGLTYADMLVYLAFGSAIAMFFVQHAGLDILLTVTAMTLSVLSCIVGMKRDPHISDLANAVRRFVYPSGLLLLASLILFHYIVLPTAGGSIGQPRAYYISSGSMQPTLQNNDRILVDQSAYKSRKPQRGDIVGFRPTEALRAQGFKSVIIARIIALPNEQVEIRDGKTLINRKPIEEPYIAEPPSYKYKSVMVPENSYFVLGDNRNNAYDSQDWGFVPRNNLVGKANLIYWPLSRYGSPYKSTHSSRR